MDKEFIDHAKNEQLTNEEMEMVVGGSDLKLRVKAPAFLSEVKKPVIWKTED